MTIYCIFVKAYIMLYKFYMKYPIFTSANIIKIIDYSIINVVKFTMPLEQ